MARVYRCPRCVATGKPPNMATPTCAFTARGAFRPSNWSCSTMLALREACAWRERDDLSAGSIGVVSVPDTGAAPQGYLVLTWYKQRGTTPGAVILDSDGKQHRLTLKRAECVLKGAGL